MEKGIVGFTGAPRSIDFPVKVDPSVHDVSIQTTAERHKNTRSIRWSANATGPSAVGGAGMYQDCVVGGPQVIQSLAEPPLREAFTTNEAME